MRYTPDADEMDGRGEYEYSVCRSAALLETDGSVGDNVDSFKSGGMLLSLSTVRESTQEEERTEACFAPQLTRAPLPPHVD